MPRAPGQIDEQKSEDILRAAVELFARKGHKASMAEIARLAGVSKQTLYNRYPSKTDLARALLTTRSLAITAPLDRGEDVEGTLRQVAIALMERHRQPHTSDHLRALALVSREDGELAAAVYSAGPGRSLDKIAAWLERQHRQETLCVPNPPEAAEIFVGMVLGHTHLRLVLGLDPVAGNDAAAHAAEAAHRFVRAYST